MAKSNFIVRGGADFSAIPKELQKLQGQFNGFSKTLGAGLKIAAASFVAKKLVEFGKEAVKVASDLAEVQNVVDVTFGSMSKDVNEFASTAIKEFGLSELSAKKFSSTMGAMLKSSGLRGTVVTDMSIDLAKLSADMASFYNLDNDAAFEKIMSGMSGMTQPLKELGINMNIANLEAFAMAQGISKSWQEMNQAEQTLTRYKYLLSVTGDAQGDFARNSGSWANQTKILKEQWKEFMGLIGKALIEVLLPFVKFVNLLLEGLISITKEIGKIYTLITGKEVVVESNNTISDTAMDAAEGEEALADGIGKAANAAKKALAPFDELNILQNNMSGGGGGGAGGIPGNATTGEINTTMSTKVVDDGFNSTKEKANAFFIWFTDQWNGLKQLLLEPILIPAPLFVSIPSPIYNPNWGLTPPLVPSPVFNPIPSPVYEPKWGLDLPPIQQPVFPAIEYGSYSKSLEAIKSTHRVMSSEIEMQNRTVSNRISEGLQTSWSMIEANYNRHKTNMGVIASGISTVLVTNINQGLSKIGINTINTVTAVQTNLQTFGKNVGSIASETAKSFANNLAEGFKVVSQDVVTFATTAGGNIKAFGVGALSIAAETARGFASNFINGLSTAWNRFKEFAVATGEKVSGWFNANKTVITTTAIAAGVVVGAGALALAAPALIPYAAAALGGMSAIPALAKGGITSGPTLAMVGDNPGGKEVVSPLDGLLDMIVQAVSTTNNSGNNINLTVKIGEDTIGERAISYINDKTIMTGESPILI